MNARPRILIIENSRQVTGALKSIVAMANDLSNEFEFFLIIPTGSAAISWIKSNSSVHVIELPMLEISKSWRLLLYEWVLYLNARRVRRIIRDKRIAIVHSNDLYNLIGPVMKTFGSTWKYVCHVRFLPDGFPSWLYSHWLDKQLAASDYVIAVSDFLKHKLRVHHKITRIYDRMIMSSDDPVSNRKGDTILYLSNIIPGKGHDHMIKAFAEIHQRFPSWKLRIVGSDMGLAKNSQYRDNLKAMAIELSIAGAIEWKDFVSDVSTEYNSADIFANFSSSESFSMTCLEAQYYGCCVVATKSGGPAEIIADGESGLLVPVADINAMVDALTKLIEDPRLRESMGTRGASLVREKFSFENTSGMLRNLYRGLLGSGGDRQ